MTAEHVAQPVAQPVSQPLAEPTTIQLDLQGMTCASCAARIAKRLNRLDGVSADVNYATARATVHSVGVSPETLIDTVRQAGYTASRPTAEPRDDAETRRLRPRMVIAAALSAPVVAMSMVSAWQFPGWQWLAFALTLPVVGWAAWPFHRAAARNARHRTATMDTLISLGTLAATGWSTYALFLGGAGRIGYTHPFEFRPMQMGGPSLYLEAAVGVTAFLLVGRYLEARAARRSGAALRALLSLTPSEVTVISDGRERRVDAATLAPGDTFVVRPGERIATDGVVVTGHSALDAASVTGESVPVEVGPEAVVIGGCVNTYGRLEVRASRVGADTQLAQIARLVEAAQAGKASVQRLADRISGVFVPIVLGLAFLTLVGWLASGAETAYAWTAAVAVLIIACPCALGLATPTALLVGTGRGAQLGILIKGPEVLGHTQAIDTVVLDKTGTVTEGRMTVAAVIAGPGESAAEVLRLAGAAEAGSEHPIARAVAAYAAAAGPLPAVRALQNRPGLGVTADLIDAPRLWTGRMELFAADGLTVSDELRAAYAAEQTQGRTALLVGWTGRARGVIAVADTVKPTSAEAVRRLRRLGLRPILLTGDHRAAAESVAAQLGITEVIAGVLPQEKAAEIIRLQEAGARVAMIGDGVNDAAALAQADLGIALGSGTDAAIEAGDLTLLRGDLRVAADAIRLARATLGVIKGNLFWAFAYNIAALPLAAAGLLNPMLAGAAMALSSLFVVTNSLRLRRFR